MLLKTHTKLVVRIFFLIVLLMVYTLGIAMTGYTDPEDIAAVSRVRMLGIKPGTPYYHQSSIPSASNRYKNFPHQEPINVEKAESEHDSPYQGVVIAELGDNYQYKTLLELPRIASFVLLPEEKTKGVENGVHFYILDKEWNLHKLENAEEALKYNDYLKMTVEMGKIISIEKKHLVQNVKTYYEYWPNGNQKYSRSEEFDEKGNIHSTIETENNEDGNLLYIIEKNKKGDTIKIYTVLKKNGIHAEKSIFNNLGIKTNYIIIHDNGDIENKQLNEKGKVISVTNIDVPENQYPDFPEEEPYKSLPIFRSKQYASEQNNIPDSFIE